MENVKPGTIKSPFKIDSIDYFYGGYQNMTQALEAMDENAEAGRLFTVPEQNGTKVLYMYQGNSTYTSVSGGGGDYLPLVGYSGDVVYNDYIIFKDSPATNEYFAISKNTILAQIGNFQYRFAREGVSYFAVESSTSAYQFDFGTFGNPAGKGLRVICQDGPQNIIFAISKNGGILNDSSGLGFVASEPQDILTKAFYDKPENLIAVINLMTAAQKTAFRNALGL